METLLRAENLVKEFPVRRGVVHAVSDVSFEIFKGETLCVVCREDEASRNPPPPAPAPLPAPADKEVPAGTAPSTPSLSAALEDTLIELCRRIRHERDPDQVLILANAVRSGVKALKQLR